MMFPSRASALRVYLWGVTASGLAILVLMIDRFSRDTRTISSSPLIFWIFAAFVVAGQLFPIALPRADGTRILTTSSTFAFAILLGWGMARAVLALAFASLIADRVQHRALQKAVFNAAQL